MPSQAAIGLAIALVLIAIYFFTQGELQQCVGSTTGTAVSTTCCMECGRRRWCHLYVCRCPVWNVVPLRAGIHNPPTSTSRFWAKRAVADVQRQGGEEGRARPPRRGVAPLQALRQGPALEEHCPVSVHAIRHDCASHAMMLPQNTPGGARDFVIVLDSLPLGRLVCILAPRSPRRHYSLHVLCYALHPRCLEPSALENVVAAKGAVADAVWSRQLDSVARKYHVHLPQQAHQAPSSAELGGERP